MMSLAVLQSALRQNGDSIEASWLWMCYEHVDQLFSDGRINWLPVC